MYMYIHMYIHMYIYVYIYWEYYPQLTNIFQRGRYTTNQYRLIEL